jgi:oligopeptide transport system ATP-binding protein
MDTDSNNMIIRVENLKKSFPIMKGILISREVGAVKAVDNVSFTIKKRETLGIVGESGCGKSTLGRAILHLHQPTSGKIIFNDIDLATLSFEGIRKMRPKMQMIFQDSYASLNPRHAVGKIIAEPMDIHTDMSLVNKRKRVMELLELVGMNPNHYDRFPHEFSGGQRQRINIARALSLNPEFIVCDEPISALDVSIQAQVVNLFKDLQEKLGLTYMFIAHDMSMVQHISDRVAVMYLGHIVELANRREIFRQAFHPYTQSLMSAIPKPNPKLERKRKRIPLDGEVPNPANPPSGCVFHTRCPIATEICTRDIPEFRSISDDHFIACHLADDKGGSLILDS